MAACDERLMTGTAAAIEIPDSTDATVSLLRELRRGHAVRRAANVAYWLYVAGLITLIYGGWLVAAIDRTLRHPRPPLAATPALMRAAPAALCTLAFLALAGLLWDARWRGPVTVSQATADWLLDTPVRRERLLRPRYRAATLVRLPLAALAGLIPAVLLLSAGIGGGAGHSLRLRQPGDAQHGTGRRHWYRPGRAGRGPPGLALFASRIEQQAPRRSRPCSRRWRPDCWRRWRGRLAASLGRYGAAVVGPVGLGGAGASPGAVRRTCTAVARRAGPRRGGGHQRLRRRRPRGSRNTGRGPESAGPHDREHVGGGGKPRRAAGGHRLPGSSRRARADQVQAAAPGAPGTGAAVARRDRAPAGPGPAGLAAFLLSWAAVGLGALAVHAPHSALLPLAGALSLGYLAAGNLCEGARLDADDTRRSGQLPFRYDSLAWWHAIVPLPDARRPGRHPGRGAGGGDGTGPRWCRSWPRPSSSWSAGR